MSNLNDEPVFKVHNGEGRFAVVDGEESVILTCCDRVSAEQYAEWMNRAYRRGFKAGLRRGREESQPQKF